MKKFVVQRCQGGSLAVAGCLLLSTLGVSAVPITGEISFGGTYKPIDAGGLAAPLETSTGIMFANPSIVLAASGEFATSLTPFTTLATFIDSFQFNPLDPSPVSALWSAGGFTFTLTDVQIDLQNSERLDLSGSGFITHDDYDPTSVSWKFGGGSFTFYSENVAPPVRTVPDGGNTMVLLGVGLVSLVLVTFKRRELAMA